jgi:hypothetical protein
MNIALIAANANQLKTLMEKLEISLSLFDKLNFHFLVTTLFLQFMLIFVSIFICCFNINNSRHTRGINFISGLVAWFTLIITLINLTITGLYFLDVLEMFIKVA